MKKLSVSAKNVLRDAGLDTNEKVIKYKQKRTFRELRNCGYITANKLCRYYGFPLEVERCPECKRKFKI